MVIKTRRSAPSAEKYSIHPHLIGKIYLCFSMVHLSLYFSVFLSTCHNSGLVSHVYDGETIRSVTLYAKCPIWCQMCENQIFMTQTVHSAILFYHIMALSINLVSCLVRHSKNVHIIKSYIIGHHRQVQTFLGMYKYPFRMHL